MAEEPLETWMVSRLSQILNVPSGRIDPSLPLTRLGLDSMVLVGFAAEVERHLGRPVDPQLFHECPTLRSLANYLSKEAK